MTLTPIDCLAFLMVCSIIVMGAVVFDKLRGALSGLDDSPTPPLTIDMDLFWEGFNSVYGGFSKYQQPIDGKLKNDELDIDEKPKNDFAEDDSESEWFVGDDGELVERKAKR